MKFIDVVCLMIDIGCFKFKGSKLHTCSDYDLQDEPNVNQQRNTVYATNLTFSIFDCVLPQAYPNYVTFIDYR